MDIERDRLVVDVDIAMTRLQPRARVPQVSTLTHSNVTHFQRCIIIVHGYTNEVPRLIKHNTYAHWRGFMPSLDQPHFLRLRRQIGACKQSENR
jgi:hypothetical protein